MSTDCEGCSYWLVLNELNGNGVCRHDIRIGGMFVQVIIPVPPLGIHCTRRKPRDYPELAPVWREWGGE